MVLQFSNARVRVVIYVAAWIGPAGPHTVQNVRANDFAISDNETIDKRSQEKPPKKAKRMSEEFKSFLRFCILSLI